MGWGLKEGIVFDHLEREILARLHELLYREHTTYASTSVGQLFEDESSRARAEYNKFGRIAAPWLKWGPERTLADVVREYQERHKDPKYQAALRELQQDLDSDALRIKKAVELELELRKQADEYRQKQREAAKKPIGRRYVRVPSRRRSLR